jgi:hypothetical protein
MKAIKLLAVGLVVVGLVGCSHTLQLSERGGGLTGTGTATEGSNAVTIVLNGKEYKGKYTYNGGGVALTNTFGSATAYGGGYSSTAYGSGFGVTSIIPSGGGGNILAMSSDGDSIRCQYSYSSGGGVGECQDSNGKIFDLMILN